MALGRPVTGRPYPLAEIPFLNARMSILDEFYSVCSTFRHRELVAVSRCLGVHYVTVQRWKYKMTFPSYETVVSVLEWEKRGKPIRMVKQSGAPATQVM